MGPFHRLTDPSVRIVTHAYAQQLPQYAVFLRAQLTGLLPVQVPRTHVTVCYTPADRAVADVIDDFILLLGNRLTLMPMSEDKLFRRSIGRNIAAKSCQESIIWFADVDHLISANCLAALWWQMMTLDENVLAWPKSLWIQREHEVGDQFVADHLHTRGEINLGCLGLAQFGFVRPSAAWEEKAYFSAIGGVQIVTGQYAREYGYLDHAPKWQQPRTDGKPFGDFRDDVKFRKHCLSQMPGKVLNLPELYRLRHTPVTYK